VYCDACGFDDADWERRDVERLLRQRDAWWDELVGPAAGDPRLTPLAERVERAEDIHTLMHLLWQGGRLLWEGSPSSTGVVEQLATSGGGVPKTPATRAVVRRRGLVGDVQRSRKHHGSPPQALCLWSADVIDALRAEGHPIGYGSAGENVTVRGLDWASVAPGQRISIGPVLAELSSWAVPCAQNRAFFLGGKFRRMSQDDHPGWSRVYARVLEGGTVTVGDPVVLEPGSSQRADQIQRGACSENAPVSTLTPTLVTPTPPVP
jgi:MOSC domain-containing protein YiiM